MSKPNYLVKDDFTEAEITRLGKELGLAPIEDKPIANDVLEMPIASMRTTITLDGTDASAKRRLSQIIDLNDSKCHGEAFRKGKANAKQVLKNIHTVKGQSYEFPEAVTRSHAKSLIHHGYNVLAHTSDDV